MLLPLKQTEKPVDQRVTDILSAARSAFAEKGFDGASMQDLARAAGMSVGNFYRYFPSKAAIVEALIAADLADMQRDFSAVITSADPMAMLRQCPGALPRRGESFPSPRPPAAPARESGPPTRAI